jgi:protein SCO1/2
MRSHRILALGLVAAVTAVTAVSCGDGEVDRELVGYRPSAAQQVDSVMVPDVSHPDEEFAFRAEPGHVLIVYFGYTSCPDVCPTSLSIVKSTVRDLGDDGDRIDLAMVTLDPDRDTAEIMSGYLGSFLDRAHALRTEDPEQLRAAAEVFGVSYRVEAQPDGTVDVSHSGAMYAVDDTGKVLVTWPFGVTKDDVQSDLEFLLA